MIPDCLHVGLLAQGFAADLFAPVGDGHHAFEDVVNHVHLAIPGQGNGVANARAVHLLVPAEHIQ